MNNQFVFVNDPATPENSTYWNTLSLCDALTICCHADQSRDANGDCPDDGEDDLPGVGGHGVFHDAMCRVVDGESRRRDEGECDHEADRKSTRMNSSH